MRLRNDRCNSVCLRDIETKELKLIMSEKKNTPLEYVHFGRWFGALYRRTQTYMKESFKDVGISFVESVLLVSAAIHEGITQDEMASKLGLAPAVVAKGLKTLEAKKLVHRQVNEANMREKHVSATPEGLELKKQIDHRVEVWNQLILEPLNDEERVHIFPALRKMSRYATQVFIHDFIQKSRPKKPFPKGRVARKKEQ